ncbi:MAG: recombinase XerC, partial [Bacteroidota bacterium]|nr:recombinase XerC [Bacteroidota bacterium]
MQKDLPTLFQDYIRECEFTRRLRSETLRGYREVFSTFQKLMPEISDPKFLLDDLMIEFFRRIQTRPRKVGKDKIIVGVKDSTVGTYWSKLRSFFKWLQGKNIIALNPLSTLKPPKVDYVDSRALDEDKLHRILAAITLHPENALLFKRDVALFHTLVYCGLRKNELLHLQVSDIDLIKNELTVRSETSKSRRTRILPMHPTLRYHIKEYFDQRKKQGFKCPTMWVNGRRDMPLTEHGLKYWVMRLEKLTGIKFHLHRFRHSFACALAKK